MAQKKTDKSQAAQQESDDSKSIKRLAAIAKLFELDPQQPIIFYNKYPFSQTEHYGRYRFVNKVEWINKHELLCPKDGLLDDPLGDYDQMLLVAMQLGNYESIDINPDIEKIGRLIRTFYNLTIDDLIKMEWLEIMYYLQDYANTKGINKKNVFEKAIINSCSAFSRRLHVLSIGILQHGLGEKTLHYIGEALEPVVGLIHHGKDFRKKIINKNIEELITLIDDIDNYLFQKIGNVTQEDGEDVYKYLRDVRKNIEKYLLNVEAVEEKADIENIGEAEIQLDETSYDILCGLADSPTRLKQVELCDIKTPKMDRTTVSKRLKYLNEIGFIEYNSKNKKGAGITPKGRDFLSKKA